MCVETGGVGGGGGVVGYSKKLDPSSYYMYTQATHMLINLIHYVLVLAWLWYLHYLFFPVILLIRYYFRDIHI